MNYDVGRKFLISVDGNETTARDNLKELGLKPTPEPLFGLIVSNNFLHEAWLQWQPGCDLRQRAWNERAWRSWLWWRGISDRPPEHLPDWKPETKTECYELGTKCKSESIGHLRLTSSLLESHGENTELERKATFSFPLLDVDNNTRTKVSVVELDILKLFHARTVVARKLVLNFHNLFTGFLFPVKGWVNCHRENEKQDHMLWILTSMITSVAILPKIYYRILASHEKVMPLETTITVGKQF